MLPNDCKNKQKNLQFALHRNFLIISPLSNPISMSFVRLLLPPRMSLFPISAAGSLILFVFPFIHTTANLLRLPLRCYSFWKASLIVFHSFPHASSPAPQVWALRTLAEPLSERVTEGLSFLRAGTGLIHLSRVAGTR